MENHQGQPSSGGNRHVTVPDHEGRGLGYAMLSSAFRDEPGARLLATFRGTRDRMFSLLATSSMAEAETCRHALQECQAILENHARDFLPLRKEYAALFMTPRGVHPYESIYLGKKRMLMDTPWVGVKDFYLSCGLEKGAEETLPEDHAAVELGFMAYLAFMGNDQDHDDQNLAPIQSQIDFLEKHILRWVPRLCEDICALKASSFYQCWAQITGSWVVLDHHVLLRAVEQKGG